MCYFQEMMEPRGVGVSTFLETLCVYSVIRSFSIIFVSLVVSAFTYFCLMDVGEVFFEHADLNQCFQKYISLGLSKRSHNTQILQALGIEIGRLVM